MTWLYVGIALFALCLITGVIAGTMYGASEEGCIGAIFGFAMGGLGGGLAGALLAGFPATWAQTHYNERTITCLVTDKDRGGKEDGMRVYTSCGTFQNTDSILRGKNTSADLYGRIKPGTEQTFTVVGWRLGLTSDFPNILEVK